MLTDRSILKGQKIVVTAKSKKIQMRILSRQKLNSVIRQVIFNRLKIGVNAKIKKILKRFSVQKRDKMFID